MALVKGITVKIDGNTTGLSESLKGVNKSISGLSSELYKVDKLLKLDPGNVELIAQKQQLLTKAIKETSEKLSALKDAKKQADEQFEKGEISEKQYRSLIREIAGTESKLNSLNNELGETSKASKKVDFKPIGDGLSDVAKKAGQVTSAIGKFTAGLVAGLVAGAVAISAKLGKEVISAFGQYEQLVGGIDTLFKENSGALQKYASNAYQTAGLSANEYMSTVTGFSASLISSLGGDTKKAVEYADMAITDMADNANKMGTDMASIQATYQSFAKQNYGMLDNLKLGYGGTKTEMERLLKDASAISGIKYDISSFADVTSAIHVMQESMGIAGATALEAETTIEGSLSSMESAFNNLVTGFGIDGADMELLVGNLVNSFQNVVANITPVIENIVNALPPMIDALLGAVVELLPTLIATLTELVKQILTTLIQILPEIIPILINSIMDIANAIIEMLPVLIPVIITLLNYIVQALLDNIVMIIEAGIQILVALVNGIVEAIPELIPQLIDVMVSIVMLLLDNIDLIIETGVTVLIALINGIIASIPLLAEKMPMIIEKIVTALIKLSPQLIMAAIQIIIALAIGIVRNIPKLLSYMPQIIVAIVNGIRAGINQIQSVGIALVEGLWNGIKDSFGWIRRKIKGWVGDVMKFIKKLFGINSPSTVLRDEVGVNMGLGVVEGILSTIGAVENAMNSLKSKVMLSVNPNINPYASSNVLITEVKPTFTINANGMDEAGARMLMGRINRQLGELL